MISISWYETGKKKKRSISDSDNIDRINRLSPTP